jgi:hypothetical protein
MKTVIAIALVALSFNAFSAIKCQPDGRGGMCCWDTDRQGPFKPINC